MNKRIVSLLVVAFLLFSVAAYAEAGASGAGSAGGDGVLRVAMASASPFSGIFNPAFTFNISDAEISYWMTEPVLLIGDDLQYNQDGAASYTYDKDAKTMTLTMKPGVKWHDGEPVTMEDLAFAYEVLADPDYPGYFFTETIGYIRGIKEYQAGSADSIAGFELSEDKQTLTIQFDVFMPSILEGGLWCFPLPKHQLGGLAVADMAADERSRERFLGFGPFMISNVVPGEMVELERFDDYWQGTPKLDGVSIEVVNPDMVPSAMEQGLYDISSFPAEAYADHQNPTNYSYLSAPDQWYQYTGFHLGHFDQESGENKTDPDAKMGDINLRLAIGHAVDLDSICGDFYSGLYGRNPTILPPNFAVYLNPDVKGYEYNPQKAMALLDEAGYVDVDGDGLREDPDGNPFVINWAVPNNNAETVVQYKLQCWRDVGLNVKLLTGNLIEMNAYYDRLFSDDDQIDMFEVGWILEESPKLPGTWGRGSIVNFPRFVSDEMDALLGALDSDQAWDADYRVKAYHDFEQYFFEQAPVIPTVWRSHLYAVNNRVRNFTLKRVYNACDRYLIELTSSEALTLSDTDYSSEANWLSFGGDGSADVDVFVVYPTVTQSMEAADRPYVRLDSELMRMAATGWLMTTQGVVSGAANVYLPLYRQLNGVELDSLTSETFESFTCATPREDIFAAFDYYLSNVNKGERPFILYGHSQGAQLVIELATTFLGNEEYDQYNENHVATYAIGCSVVQAQIEKNPYLRFSASGDDTGVMVSWNSTAPSEVASEAYKNFGTWKPGALVTNPLTWVTDETTAPAAPFAGMLPGPDGGKPIEGSADATVDKERGILVVTTVDESQYLPLSEKVSRYHSCDVVFFADSIRRNIANRIEMFLAS